jgi:hypothetical protein
MFPKEDFATESKFFGSVCTKEEEDEAEGKEGTLSTHTLLLDTGHFTIALHNLHRIASHRFAAVMPCRLLSSRASDGAR